MFITEHSNNTENYKKKGKSLRNPLPLAPQPQFAGLPVGTCTHIIRTFTQMGSHYAEHGCFLFSLLSCSLSLSCILVCVCVCVCMYFFLLVTVVMHHPS